MEYQEQVFAFV